MTTNKWRTEFFALSLVFALLRTTDIARVLSVVAQFSLHRLLKKNPFHIVSLSMFRSFHRPFRGSEQRPEGKNSFKHLDSFMTFNDFHDLSDLDDLK